MIFGSWIFSCEPLTTFTLWYYHIGLCHSAQQHAQYCFCLLHKDVKTFVSVEVKQLCKKKKKSEYVSVLLPHME